jgi:predicted DNA-binding protein
MDEKKPKLKISPKKYIGETSVISMRLPKDMIKDLDNTAEVTGRTRNEIMLMCLEYALKNMEITFND